MDFREAIEQGAVKRLMPTTLKTAELNKLEAGLRERARFSAQVMDAKFLQEADTLIKSIVQPQPDAAGVMTGMDQATARLKLSDYLKSVDYEPEPGKEGTIEDLSGDARLNLIIKTNVDMARGYGQWAKHQSTAVLDEWPAFVFERQEERVEPRDWPTRWAEAGGSFYPSDDADYPEGLMVALVNDPIWEEISAFGLPYAPFDFNSGMGLRPLSRQECEEIGFELPEEPQEPEDREFGDDIQASLETMEPELQAATVQSLVKAGLDVVFGEDGILRMAGEALGLGNERANEAQPLVFLVRVAAAEPDRIGGWQDWPLSEAGRQQAAEAGCELGGWPIGRVWSSPMACAGETASIIGSLNGENEHQAQIVRTYGLMPWHLGPGIEGWPKDMMADRVRALVEAPGERPFGGETFNEFKSRVIDAWKRITDGSIANEGIPCGDSGTSQVRCGGSRV